jgi:hypothetical protein
MCRTRWLGSWRTNSLVGVAWPEPYSGTTQLCSTILQFVLMFQIFDFIRTALNLNQCRKFYNK